MRNGPYELVVAPVAYPGKKYRGRYVYEHQLVWWQTTGQVVPEGFVVHHKDEQKRNNVFSNFELKSVGQHTREHDKERANPPVEVVCGWCGGKFNIPFYNYNCRIKQSVSGNLYCSKSHQVKAQQAALREGRKAT